MEAFKISGGSRLTGTIEVRGSKNATLPLLAATLLADGESVIRGVPDLVDVRTMASLLGSMGATVVHEDRALRVQPAPALVPEAPYDLVRTMRASFLVLGPLLARFGKARVSLPGGCAIGARPIDQHLKGLQRLGARIRIEHGYVEAEANGLQGGQVHFDMPTVGGTEHLMLAAALAQGTTVLRNAAREPEIVDLAAALSSMGAEVVGAGTPDLTIRGRSVLQPLLHTVIPDRIEFGTFLVAGALAGDPLTVVGGRDEHQSALLDKLEAAGVSCLREGGRVTLQRPEVLRPLEVQTAPYPGFPTDMQAQLMALLTQARGTSVMSETVFENRFMHVPELNRLGANITVKGGKAIIHGPSRLSGSTVMATDLRASACLVLAGLVAEGETKVRRIYHLDRGYERIGRRLRAVGAQIRRYAE